MIKDFRVLKHMIEVFYWWLCIPIVFLSFFNASMIVSHLTSGYWKATGQNFRNRFNCNQMTSKLVNMEILAC